MEAKRLVINSLCGENPITRGFFVPLEDKSSCYHCKKEYFVMHPTTQGRYWCADCYVKTYCHIINTKDGFIIKLKNPSKILYQFFSHHREESNPKEEGNGVEDGMESKALDCKIFN